MNTMKFFHDHNFDLLIYFSIFQLTMPLSTNFQFRHFSHQHQQKLSQLTGLNLNKIFHQFIPATLILEK